jgi:hypothetical protein
MPPETIVLIDRLQEFFPDEPDLAKAEPFSLDVLASRPVAERPASSGEGDGGAAPDAAERSLRRLEISDTVHSIP